MGGSAQALQILQNAGLSAPASEMVLVHDSGQTADAAGFRQAVDQVVTAVQGAGQTTDIQSPYSTGLISKDRHYALVQFDMTRRPRHGLGPGATRARRRRRKVQAANPTVQDQRGRLTRPAASG